MVAHPEETLAELWQSSWETCSWCTALGKNPSAPMQVTQPDELLDSWPSVEPEGQGSGLGRCGSLDALQQVVVQLVHRPALLAQLALHHGDPPRLHSCTGAPAEPAAAPQHPPGSAGPVHDRGMFGNPPAEQLAVHAGAQARALRASRQAAPAAWCLGEAWDALGSSVVQSAEDAEPAREQEGSSCGTGCAKVRIRAV